MWGWWNNLLSDCRNWKRGGQNRHSGSSSKRFSRKLGQKAHGLAQTILHRRIESGNVEAALELREEIRHNGQKKETNRYL